MSKRLDARSDVAVGLDPALGENGRVGEAPVHVGNDELLDQAAEPVHDLEALTNLDDVAEVLEGTGAYTGVERPVLYCVVSRAEVATLKAIVREVDPHAFMVIGSAHEALGEGFRPLKDK